MWHPALSSPSKTASACAPHMHTTERDDTLMHLAAFACGDVQQLSDAAILCSLPPEWGSTMVSLELLYFSHTQGIVFFWVTCSIKSDSWIADAGGIVKPANLAVIARMP